MTFTCTNIETLTPDFNDFDVSDFDAGNSDVNDLDKAVSMPAYFPRHRRTVRQRRRGAVRRNAVPPVLKRLIGLFIRT